MEDIRERVRLTIRNEMGYDALSFGEKIAVGIEAGNAADALIGQGLLNPVVVVHLIEPTHALGCYGPFADMSDAWEWAMDHLPSGEWVIFRPTSPAEVAPRVSVTSTP